MTRKIFSFLIALSLGPQLLAAEALLEYQVKAVCVLNAARFVSWPASAFDEATSPVVVGILGDNLLGSTLQAVVKGETIQNRPIVVRRVTLEEVSSVHILFVSNSERDQLHRVLRALGDANVLTISEINGFTQSGGMLGLALARGKIRFEINSEAAVRAQLKIDSQFLLLARSAR